jgi:hypothetical protein
MSPEQLGATFRVALIPLSPDTKKLRFCVLGTLGIQADRELIADTFAKIAVPVDVSDHGHAGLALTYLLTIARCGL